MSWSLDPRLEADSHFVADLELCQVRLMGNAHVPWLVLVPRRADAVEWIDLEPEDRHRLLDEVTAACEALRSLHGPAKFNIGALGNIVRQLHVHVLARDGHDPAWPGPVWGALPPRAYAEDARATAVAALQAALRQA